MKKIIVVLVPTVLLVWVAMVVEKSMGKNQSPPPMEQLDARGQEVHSSSFCERDEAGGREQVLDAAFTEPDVFQARSIDPREEPTPLIVPKERPQQLSEVKQPAREKMRKESVAATDLYFWSDYESLRKKEIRNPDSVAHRTGGIVLMLMRQRRASSKNKKNAF